MLIGEFMNIKFKKTIKKILRYFNIGVTNAKILDDLLLNINAVNDLKFILNMPNDKASELLKYFLKSKSQIHQDLFVLTQLNFKKNGYFIEFGATNGFDLSNTHLLEKEFEWNGILAEPAKCWHSDLKNNRSCNIETACVWSNSNSILTFNEVRNAEYSTISNFSKSDIHKDNRENGKKYELITISLIELLEKYNAPKLIDYLSIDTEGSEFEILRNFDFSKYSFNVITCEHNFTASREKLFILLTKHGYVRVHQNLSLFDDWYIRPSD